MSNEELKSWRTIVELLKGLGYDILYSDDISRVADYLKNSERVKK